LLDEGLWQPVSQTLAANPVDIKMALVRTDYSVAKVSRLAERSPIGRAREWCGRRRQRWTGFNSFRNRRGRSWTAPIDLLALTIGNLSLENEEFSDYAG